MPTPAFLAGERLPAPKLQQLGDDDIYTPSLLASTTNPTLGSGATQDGLIWINGETVSIMFNITFGSSGVNPGSGDYTISLPTGLSIVGFANGIALGQVHLDDLSAGTGGHLGGFVIQSGANTDRVGLRRSDTGGLVTDASPWTWATGDFIRGSLAYRTDFT